MTQQETRQKEVEKVEDTKSYNSDTSSNDFDQNQGLVKFLKNHWATIAVLIYILSPIDLIPDFIPVAGNIDDVSLLVFQLYQEYKASKKRNA